MYIHYIENGVKCQIIDNVQRLSLEKYRMYKVVKKQSVEYIQTNKKKIGRYTYAF